MRKILFICLGNICRSSAAEEIMHTFIMQAGMEKELSVDSAGLISYHEGELSDDRMRLHASRRGYRLTHRSRPIHKDDFLEFDMIIGMDKQNIKELMKRAPGTEEQKKIHLMTEFCQNKTASCVPDPYYGIDSDFENVLDILEDTCQGLLEYLQQN